LELYFRDWEKVPIGSSTGVACGIFTPSRKCPGVHFIQSSLWLVIARVVATLDIKANVVNGVPVEVNLKEKNPFFR